MQNNDSKSRYNNENLNLLEEMAVCQVDLTYTCRKLVLNYITIFAK
jgi:hypothetical protein